MRRRAVVVPLVGGLACGLGEPAVPSGPPVPPPDALPRTLNWSDPTFGAYYRADEGCFLELPFDEPPTAVVPPPTKAVPCPPAMRGPAWKACVGGIVFQSAPDDCECRVFGNPPPPPRAVKCPKGER